MFPIGDDNRDRQHTPIVTYALITLNVIAFVYTLSLGNSQDFFITNWSVIPDRFTHLVPLPRDYALLTAAPWATLFTALFLHGGWLHIIGNMLFLFIFGDNVEDAMGPVRYLIFYLLVGLAGNLTHIFFNATSLVPSIGASGAIAGVLAAYLVLKPRGRVTNILWLGILFIPITLPAWIDIGYWFLTQLFNGVGSLSANFRSGGTGDGVAYWAHIGGFIAGLILVKPFTIGRARPYGYGARLNVPTYDYSRYR